MQHQREEQQKAEQLQQAAQQIVNEAYLQKKHDDEARRQKKSDQEIEARRQRDTEEASRLLDEAFPLASNSNSTRASSPSNPPADTSSGVQSPALQRHGKPMRPHRKKRSPPKSTSAVDTLLNGGTLNGLPRYTADPGSRDVGQGLNGVTEGGDAYRGLAIPAREKKLLLNAIKQELAKHKRSSWKE